MRTNFYLPFLVILLCSTFIFVASSQEEDYETIGSETCIECHEESEQGTVIADDISHSAHDGMV